MGSMNAEIGRGMHAGCFKSEYQSSADGGRTMLRAALQLCVQCYTMPPRLAPSPCQQPLRRRVQSTSGSTVGAAPLLPLLLPLPLLAESPDEPSIRL